MSYDPLFEKYGDHSTVADVVRAEQARERQYEEEMERQYEEEMERERNAPDLEIFTECWNCGGGKFSPGGFDDLGTHITICNGCHERQEEV